ncbi:DNA-binding protein [Bacteroidia bacterium]|nr:DNA-binding protein [Bacteroidia bacterium]
MAVNYDFYRNPAPTDSGREPRLHARAVTSGTITTGQMAESISKCSSATKGDVQLVLTQLVAETRKWLSLGYRVHIEGLGYLSLTLAAPPVQTSHEIRAESIHVKGVKLRPDAEMKQAVADFHIARAQVKRHSKQHTGEDIDAGLLHYFASHASMPSADFLRLFAFTRTTGMRRLRQLVEARKLAKSGHPSFPLYLPGENLSR